MKNGLYVLGFLLCGEFCIGQFWNTSVTVSSSGVSEIGKYLDFHESSNDINDYSIRLYSEDNILKFTSSLYVKGLNLDGHSLGFMPNSRAFLLGWNRSRGEGETNFISNRGSGSLGGFDFSDIDNFGNEHLLLKIRGNGNIGIGTTSPTGKLEILKNADLSNTLTIPNSGLIIRADNDGNDASLRFGVDNTNLKAVIQTQQTTTGAKFDLLVNPFGGNVGIGTTAPDAELTVKGNIHSEEVKVDLSVPAPDYVFKEGYDLKSLEEVQSYIKENGHLPNIPSAEEMEANGIQLGIMNMKLLEKIEELTLYTLEQDKLLKQLLLKVNELDKANARLQEQLIKL